MQSSVRSNKHGIGFVDFSFVEGTNVVSYKGVTCNLRNAKSGQYGGTRNFWMVTKGRPKGATRLFLRWIRSSADQDRRNQLGPDPPSGQA